MISAKGRYLALATFVTTYPSMARPSQRARDSTGHIAARTEASSFRSVTQQSLPEELHGAINLEVKGDGAKSAKQAPSEKILLPTSAQTALTELQAMSVRSAKQARGRMQWFTEILGEIHRA